MLDALGSFGTILGVLVIVLLNREWANAISDWGGVSPWWALVPMIVLAVYVIARANYREFVEVDGRAQRQQETEAALRQKEKLVELQQEQNALLRKELNVSQAQYEVFKGWQAEHGQRF